MVPHNQQTGDFPTVPLQNGSYWIAGGNLTAGNTAVYNGKDDIKTGRERIQHTMMVLHVRDKFAFSPFFDADFFT